MPEIRLPPGLAETEISIFANAKDTDPKPVRLGPILSAIKNGRWADPIAKLRELLDAGNREAYDEQKKDLPAVTLSGSFEKRNAAGLIQHSGLLQIDLDHLGKPAEVRDQLAADPHVAAALLSPSAQGVKGVMLMPPGDAERHKHAFKAAVNYLQETYGLENDRACKDVCRMMFVSHDPGLRTNPDAVVLDVKRWTPEEPQPSFVSSEERPPSEENERVRDALTHLSSEAYADWIRICAALKNSNLPGAFELWHEWSAQASTYQGSEDCLGVWDDLKPNTGINVDAIYKAACDAGWNPMGQPRTHAKSTGGGWTEPQPLPKHPLPPPQLDPGVLPEPLAEYARAAALENEVAP
ncbi:MAG: BT4734/BF3469 family protein, partial [SAR324 cluster bacterium]|nr:BT4734/BF3469 family protein [SAR324 cluster bacterium]